MKKICLLIISVVLIGCQKKNDTDNKVSIFITIADEYTSTVVLWIDDSLFYEGLYNPGYRAAYTDEMVVAYVEKDSIDRRFRVKINELDTTFMYSMKGVDSLAISVSFYDDLFHVTHSKRAWWRD